MMKMKAKNSAVPTIPTAESHQTTRRLFPLPLETSRDAPWPIFREYLRDGADPLYIDKSVQVTILPDGARDRHFQNRSWLDPGDRWYPIYGPIERRDLAYFGRFGRCNEIRLGIVDAVRFVDLKGT